MPGSAELDQVADVRRKLATQALGTLPESSRTQSMFEIGAYVVLLGIPIWKLFLPGLFTGAGAWVMLAVMLLFVAYPRIKERRHGVRLPHRMNAYPSARKAHYAFLAIFTVNIGVVGLLVDFGHLVIASVLSVPAAVALFVCEKVARTKMREDIEAGRVSVGL
ncbi:hypothetical protein [Amycolatopsis sp. YIM 10]|uniref:hypothetical protein n=1 Tax=Amycolatopsis sp. YIM 10 TaxID=2653857 RepID=UPI0012900F49|nr:hypothetical protein [Amycolatopsis sp. YIM 10]QFU91105.1 hypothetical protein YIM_29695 [Amycolatopsis sp. YIM 10]